MAAPLPSPDPDDAPSPKREAILRAGCRLFLEYGYGAVTMDAIARDANVSKRTVYSYFASKESLFAGVMTAMCDLLGDRALPAETPDGPPEQVLQTVGEKFLNLVTSPNGIALFRIVVGESARFPELGATFYATGPKRLVDSIATYLKEQDRKGSLAVAEPERAAMQFLDLAKSSLHLRLVLGIGEEPDTAEKQAAVREAVGCFLRVYGRGA
ncbi:MAG: TetR/AcrR family transcriptional regulator [Alphaproteobacteria bacterium]|nr:TetR/AcrR family transcriptional regulator [Alphaproteobacteria bacterium]